MKLKNPIYIKNLINPPTTKLLSLFSDNKLKKFLKNIGIIESIAVAPVIDKSTITNDNL